MLLLLSNITYLLLGSTEDAFARTKTAAIIKSMVHFTQNGIVDILKNNSFKLDTFLKKPFFDLKDLKCTCQSDKNSTS